MTDFVEKHLATKPDLLVKAKTDEQMFFWAPVIMGIVSREEMEAATMEELQFYNELAVKKQQYLGLGASDEDG